MIKMLIVDDDVELANALRESFAQQKLTLDVRYSGEDALRLLAEQTYDLLILDWNLPGIDGVSLCRKFRDSGGSSYIIFLTGQSDISSKEEALDAGGDDFISKPFHVRELLARIRSVTRRSAELLSENIVIGGVSLDPQSRVASFEGKSLALTKKECALLEYLMRHPDRPITAQKLLVAIWPSETDSSVETVRTWMMNLREKLNELGKPDFIKTVVRSGYVIESD